MKKPFGIYRLCCAVVLIGIVFWSNSFADFINDKIKVVISQQDVASFFPSSNVKISFVVDSSTVVVSSTGAQTKTLKSRNICFVDLSTTPYTITTIPAATTGVLPVISPDGQWIAYAKGVEGDGEQTAGTISTSWMCDLAASGTAIKIADTGFVPRFIKNATNPTVVYSTCALNPAGANQTFLCGKVLKREVINRTVQTAQVVWGSGSYFGGLSYDNRYLATAWLAGDGSRMLDLQNGLAGPAFIHNIPAKTSTNKDTLIQIGTCNPSISSSTVFTKTMMYFDFGSDAVNIANCTSPLLGEWGLHTRIFITGIDSVIRRIYDLPTYTPYVPNPIGQGERRGTGEWDNPEWSNHPYYAAASVLVDRLWKSQPTWSYRHSYIHEQVHAINLKNSTYKQLLQIVDTSYTAGIDIKWPFIWVQVPTSFSEDAQWLANPVGVVPHQSVRNIQGFSVAIHNGIVRSSIPIRILNIYSVKGELVASVQGCAMQQISVPVVSGGSYIVKAISSNGRTAIVRYSGM